MNRIALAQKAAPALALSAVLLASLAACGGGSSSEQTAQPAAIDSGTASTQSTTDASVSDAALAATLARTQALPTYHMAPVLLDEPDSTDVGGSNASAHRMPRSFTIDGSVADIDTTRLSRNALKQRIADVAGKARVASAGSDSVSPQATAIVGAVHTPAQIRAAYGLPDAPTSAAGLTAAQAAALGAGQTIYLIDAYHDASALSDLNAFSAKFGLPTCTNVAVAATATLPLATPPTNCTFSQISATTAGAMTATAPAYNATWAPESKLDVQWAHAIAPLARLVLIEMPNDMSNSILGAAGLTAKMGAGVVSMSFGSAEASWTSSIDWHFSSAGMTYVAATGDTGSQVLWPAVSATVLAVGGTSLNWSGTGTRYEAAWASGGGGESAYETLPAWQSGVTPAGGSALVRRAVPDVAFDSNPSTGEYVAVTLPGQPTVWNSYGGTSIAAPQWAGVIAVANAVRVANAKAVLGDVHSLLYKSIANVPGTYAASFGDVVDGTNGTCATCRAGTGYDEATGLGSPNVAGMMPALTGVSAPLSTPTAVPSVPGGSFIGKVGTALSQSLNVVAPSGTTTRYALSGAPGGLAVNASGVLTWAAPVAGSYAFTATATTAAGKSASASYSLKVIAATAPVFAGSGKFSASAGTAFAGTLSASNPNGATLSYSLAGAPSGLTASATGALGWAAPVAGTYSFTAKVTDSYGYSSTQTETLTVAPAKVVAAGPKLASATYAVKTGAMFSTTLKATDASSTSLTYSVSGAPAALHVMSGGYTYWVGAVKGTYTFTVTVRDPQGATGSATITLVVS